MPNVITDLKWTTTNGSAYKQEAPRILARPYLVDQNAIAATFSTYANLRTNSGGVRYYENLHPNAKDLNKEYVLPYFNDELRSFNNTWGSTYIGSTNGTQAGGSQFLGEVNTFADIAITTIAQGAAYLNNKSGALFEPPKYYQYTPDEGAVSVDFILINTDEQGDYEANYKFIADLIKLNRFKRDELLATTPPVLWKVIVPGYRYIRWASGGMSVSMQGKRILKDGKLIPEGFKINLSFTPLYTEPSNYMDEGELLL